MFSSLPSISSLNPFKPSTAQLDAAMQKGVEKERNRILSLIQGEQMPQGQLSEKDKDKMLLATRKPDPFSLSEKFQIQRAFTPPLKPELIKQLVEKNKENLLANYMFAVRTLVKKSAFNKTPELIFQSLDTLTELDEPMKKLLGNVLDVGLKNKENIDIGTIIEFSDKEKNQEAVKYFKRLLSAVQKGGRTRRNRGKTRRKRGRKNRKSRK